LLLRPRIFILGKHFPEVIVLICRIPLAKLYRRLSLFSQSTCVGLGTSYRIKLVFIDCTNFSLSAIVYSSRYNNSLSIIFARSIGLLLPKLCPVTSLLTFLF